MKLHVTYSCNRSNEAWFPNWCFHDYSKTNQIWMLLYICCFSKLRHPVLISKHTVGPEKASSILNHLVRIPASASNSVLYLSWFQCFFISLAGMQTVQWCRALLYQFLTTVLHTGRYPQFTLLLLSLPLLPLERWGVCLIPRLPLLLRITIYTPGRWLA
jgi:hypothetical protein